MVQANSGKDNLWTQVDLLVQQMEGFLKGYNDHAPAQQQMSIMEVIVINTAGDRETL